MKPENLRKQKNYLWRLLVLLIPLIFIVAIVNQAVTSWGLSSFIAFFVLLFALALYFAYATWCYLQSKK